MMAMSRFFIFSFSRSGSTVLGQKLNNHSQIKVINESGLFTLLGILNWKMLGPYRQRFLIHHWNKNQPQKRRIANISEKPISVNDFYTNILGDSVPIIGEKTPTNVFYSDYISKIIKDAKFIFLKRHPLAIAHSYFNRWHNKSYSDRFLIDVVSVIKAYHREFLKFKTNNHLEIAYEKLVTDSKEILSAISDYLSVKFEEQMLDESSRLFEGSDTEQHHQDVHKKFSIQKIDSFRKTFTPSQLDELSYLLRKEISELGYPTENFKTPCWRLQQIEKAIEKNHENLRILKRKQYIYLRTLLSFYKFCLFHFLKLK